MLVLVEVFLDSSGTTDAEIKIHVDDDADDIDEISLSELLPAGLGTSDSRQFCVHVSPGSRYKLTNDSDPNSNNSINFAREFTL